MGWNHRNHYFQSSRYFPSLETGKIRCQTVWWNSKYNNICMLFLDKPGWLVQARPKTYHWQNRWVRIWVLALVRISAMVDPPLPQHSTTATTEPPVERLIRKDHTVISIMSIFIDVDTVNTLNVSCIYTKLHIYMNKTVHTYICFSM